MYTIAMTKLSTEDIMKLASLARLKLSENEAKRYQTEFNSILDYVKQLSDVDTEGLKPTYQVNNLVNVMRPDKELDYGTNQKSLLKNVPKVQDNFIQVERMI